MCFLWGGGGEGKGLDTCFRFKGSVEIRRSKMLFLLFSLYKFQQVLISVKVHFKFDMLFFVEGRVQDFVVATKPGVFKG